jgi:hypothetical protein
MYPEALLLGGILAYLFVKYMRYKNAWRIGLLVVAIGLLGYPSRIHSSKSFDLFLLVDRSRSISDEGRSKQMELLQLIDRQLENGDNLGIVSFNEKSHIEQAADSRATIQSFSIPYSEDASDLSEGLQTVLSQVQENRTTKIFILSDGEYTGQTPIREAHIARQRKIPIYYRNQKRLELYNLSVSDVDLPEKILAEEPFHITFTVQSTVQTSGRYRLYRNGNIIGSQENQGWRTTNFKKGVNQIRHVDVVRSTGIHSYQIEVESTNPDTSETMLKDNMAERFIRVIAERPILLVNNTGAEDSVSHILSAGGLRTHIIHIDDFHFTIERLEGYKGIILNNVSIIQLTLQQIRALRDFVLQEGGGLLVCGGNRSYAAGGFYKSELEAILPVSLEDRQQSKKVSTAFSIILDRSGSMQMTTPSGETKMELANNASAECVHLMSPLDSLSVIAVDSLAHLIVPQQPVQFGEEIVHDILTIESMGGGIFVYTGLVAAGQQLLQASQANKHILLFSDAMDSEEPGDYKNLINQYIQAGITISVVGLGTETDIDAEFLKDIAARGNGSIYFTQDAAQLTQFFTADTITYTRNSFIEEPAPMKIKANAYTISPDLQWQDFSCAGYNLLFAKPEAEHAIMTTDEDQAPILSFWQRGLGRVCTLALDANLDFSSTAHYGDILLSSTRWIMGSQVHDNLQIKTDYEGSYARVRMDVSQQEREQMGQPKLITFSPSGKTITHPMQWDSHSRLSSTVKLSEAGCYRGVIQVGDMSYKVNPMSIPISPEFIYDRDDVGNDRSAMNFGEQTLNQLAAISGGREVLDIREIFDRSDRHHFIRPVIGAFILAYLLLLLLEIAEARFAMLITLKQWYTGAKAKWRYRKPLLQPAEQAHPPATARTKTDKPVPAPHTPPSAGMEKKPTPAPSPAQPEPDKESMAYLAKSKDRAKKKLQK